MDRVRNLGFLLKDIQRLYTRLFEHSASHLDVTLDQCKVLSYLSRNEGVSQTRLAELSGLEPMSLVRILDRMEGDGWIERRTHPTDRRARQLYLKDKAQPTLEQLWKQSDQVRAQALVGLKADERTVLIDLLERVQANLLEAKLDESAAARTQSASRANAAKTPHTTARSSASSGAAARSKANKSSSNR